MSCEVRCKCHVNLCLKIPETQPRVSQGPHKRQDSATQSPHPTMTAMSLLHLQTPECLCGSLQPAGTHSTHRAIHRCTSMSTWAHTGQHPFYLPGKGVENADHTFQRNTVLGGMRYSQVAHKVHLIPMAQSCQHNTT